MPIVTARPQERWIARGEPAVPSLRIFCATDAVPNTRIRNVPRNSAAASRKVPRSMADYEGVRSRVEGLEAEPFEIPRSFG